MERLQVITIPDFAENNITMQCLELSNNMLQELNMAKKAWHESTNCIEQKSLSGHEQKRHRKYDGNRLNIANFMTDSDLEKNKA